MPANETAWSYIKRSYLAPYIHWFWLLIVCTLIGSLGAFAIAKAQQPVYRATTQLIVNAPSSIAPVATDQVATMYAQLVAQPVVLNRAVAVARLRGVTAADLATRMQASAPSNTALITISVDDTDAGRAAALTNAVATEFISTLNERGLTDTYSVVVFQPAFPPPTPDHPNPANSALIGGASGLALALVLVHFLAVADRKQLSTSTHPEGASNGRIASAEEDVRREMSTHSRHTSA